ncbi:hypothetical protein IV52_GL000131 [Fructilactobacillus lindneri DSM 20690 = JCM 11027]|uniref:Uncharacterized protein n=1 Tax=Fructilactobacillus lindneri DSM 20690 = JCM 11027 TaxID=1122148 RepID=A0A0R2JSG7_9LACO|nr:hypothetical protein IV52_GL000131 [Fructilactobacillus lindneri DSM 20690 = JCM 11027]
MRLRTNERFINSSACVLEVRHSNEIKNQLYHHTTNFRVLEVRHSNEIKNGPEEITTPSGVLEVRHSNEIKNSIRYS